MDFSGHYGEEFPWHTRVVSDLVEMLRQMTKNLDKDAQIELRKMVSRSLLKTFEKNCLGKTHHISSLKAWIRGDL